jgi:hypothetical protein
MRAEDLLKDVSAFLETWEDTPNQTKKAFVHLMQYLAAKEDLKFNLKGRPGVSYSLRASHTLQTSRELFTLVDIIDEDPENRWLSVCFYNDMITDPAEKGELIPFGILEEDGYCFNVEQWDEAYLFYLEARIDEAYESATG